MNRLRKTVGNISVLFFNNQARFRAYQAVSTDSADFCLVTARVLHMAGP